MTRFVIGWLLALLSAACTTIPSPQERLAHADALAAQKGWQASRIRAGRFELVAYAPPHSPSVELLTIYIEGDGFAWVSSTTPSIDPTPRNPLALRLALAHPEGDAVYLARPCQYVDAARSGCAQRYWTNARFAADVVEAENLAVDHLKQRFGANRLVLVGYSGGGAVAALVAARRTDVVRLVTVAGNLDHRAWTSHHRVEALSGSLNAADVADQLSKLPQTHFIGGKDRVIPPDLAKRWPDEFAGVNVYHLHVIPDFDHACCWAESWSALMKVDD